MEELVNFGRSCKEMMVTELTARLKESANIFVTNYLGLSSTDIEQLRNDLKKSSANFVVVKNAIARKALSELSLKEVADLVDGGVGFGLAGEDPVAASKAIMDFTKSHGKLKLRGAYLFGAIVTDERVKQIAQLPSREVLLARALSGMKSPITGFVGALSGIMRKLVWCLEAIKETKEPK